MKIAILHPWFLMRGGGEKVIEVIAGMYPDADVFCIFANSASLSPVLRSRRIIVSPLNSVPWSAKLHFHLMPLYPWAIESLDLRGYDLVISSCGPVMMGANLPQGAVHVCYCHTPPRAWWDLYAEQQARLSWLPRYIYTFAGTLVRMWEFTAMQRVDRVIANSCYIATRISQYFRRDSIVIYPPVDTAKGFLADYTEDFYLTVSRLGREKRIDLLIQACNKLTLRLRIVGVGREEKHLKAIAGPTIEFLGRVRDEDLSALYSRCRAFLFAANEDFGIAPVEAQSYGRPVIAYGRGGVLETVQVGDQNNCGSGVLFPKQTVESVISGILEFEKKEELFSPSWIRDHAQQFDTSVFIDRFRNIVDNAVQHGSARGL